MCACVRHWKLGTQSTIASHSVVAKPNGLRGLSSDWDVESKWKEYFRVRSKANLDLDKQLSLVLSNYSAVQVFFSEGIFSALCLPCFHFSPSPLSISPDESNDQWWTALKYNSFFIKQSFFQVPRNVHHQCYFIVPCESNICFHSSIFQCANKITRLFMNWKKMFLYPCYKSCFFGCNAFPLLTY